MAAPTLLAPIAPERFAFPVSMVRKRGPFARSISLAPSQAKLENRHLASSVSPVVGWGFVNC
jgi:hypothetical protein